MSGTKQDELILRLLAELAYVHTTCDITDSVRNSCDLREEAAAYLGYGSFEEFREADQQEGLE